MDARRTNRLAEIARLLANEIRDKGDAILIVREVAKACASATNTSVLPLLAETAGVTAAETGASRGRVAVLAGAAYDQVAYAKEPS